MKKAIITILFLAAIFGSKAQTVTKDSNGNYKAAKATVIHEKDNGQDTGKTYADSNGKIYKVFKSKNGKLFVNRVSQKTGNPYKFYLKTN